MSDRAKNERAPDENVDAGTDAAEGAEAPETHNADYEAFMRLVNENEELKDRALRAAAEMENLRRRTARDVHDARSYAIANFARDMLAVSDNLRRALDAIPAEAKNSGDAAITALIEGVEMTERAMLAALERHGVKKLEPEGERFDPHFHQAMFEVPNPDVPSNTVVNVVQAGYVIGERVLRPAMVGVSKGGPKQVAQEKQAQSGHAGNDDSPQQEETAEAESETTVEPGPPNPYMEKDA
jgi:molecular chaperone GrpE